MRISNSVLAAAAALNSPEVQELIEFYKFITEDQEYESYVARVVTLNKWNEDLIANRVSIISDASAVSVVSTKKGDKELDISKEEAKRDKEVDRVLKFLEKQPDLLEGTRKMRLQLTKESEELLKTDKRLKSSQDLAM